MMQALAPQPYADDATRWQAVLNRDPAAEGIFYYAVSTTGVYCRPTCPSRRPRVEHVAYFSTPESAETAGFRACRRCTPNEISAQQQAVARVQQMLETEEPAPSLAELGAAVGFSSMHLQRVFKRMTGSSPREYAAAVRLRRLKHGLQEGATVTEALYDAGYGSSRALYDTARQQLGMRPGAYRKGGQGERVGYALVDSPLGGLFIAATEQGMCFLGFGEEDTLVAELRREFPQAELCHDPEMVAPHVDAVLQHLNGQQPHLTLPLDPKGTAFQQRVWSALRQIPYGETRTYRQLAEMLGMPTGARAVAHACATNPVSVAIPCHRVIGVQGDLRGYRWGLDRKRALLESERRYGAGPSLTISGAATPSTPETGE